MIFGNLFGLSFFLLSNCPITVPLCLSDPICVALQLTLSITLCRFFLCHYIFCSNSSSLLRKLNRNETLWEHIRRTRRRSTVAPVNCHDMPSKRVGVLGPQFIGLLIGAYSVANICRHIQCPHEVSGWHKVLGSLNFLPNSFTPVDIVLARLPLSYEPICSFSRCHVLVYEVVQDWIISSI